MDIPVMPELITAADKGVFDESSVLYFGGVGVYDYRL